MDQRDIHRLIGVICNAHEEPSVESSILCELLDACSIEFHELSIKDSLYLSWAMQRLHYFSEALSLRRMATEKFVSLKRDQKWLNSFEIRYLNYCLMERGEFLKSSLVPFAVDFLSKPRSILALRQDLVLLETLTSGNGVPNSLEKRLITAPDSVRAKLEREDLRIAIVGPGPIEKNLNDLIDSYDLVARLRGSESDELNRGTRTDLFYMNGNMTKFMVDENRVIPLSKQFLLIGRGVGTTFDKQGGVECLNVDYLFPISSLLMGVRSILDLLVFRPIEIGVFGMDFYLNHTSYANIETPFSFIPNVSGFDGNNFFRKGSHDVYMSYFFAELLVKRSLCKIQFFDTTGERINLAREIFVQELELAYERKP